MRQNSLTFNRRCRMCGSFSFILVFDFGKTPLANAFLTKPQLTKPEAVFPLRVYLCKKCHLLQLRDVVSPQLLFQNYVYVSSTSNVFIQHFADYAEHVVKDLRVKPKSLVIDIGSNDGILLTPFSKLGCKVLGIEPAKNIARMANAKNIPTLVQYISVKLGKRIRAKFGAAKIITANNVFAHINNLNEVVLSVLEMLGDDGVFIIEAPYLVDFLQKNLFDTVYHEHLSYLSVSPLIRFFKKYKLQVFRIEKTSSHGGSIRVYISKNIKLYPVENSVKIFTINEAKTGLQRIITYKDFFKRILENKLQLLKLIKVLKTNGKHIAGYGAPAKGNTLLNFFGINTNYVDYIVDDSTFKQSLYTPGTHIPVVSAKKISQSKPDYLLLLAWNFKDAIISAQGEFQKSGGKFIVPVPKPQII